ncbi:RhoGAP-domain-containing protein [Rhizopus microsporus ATCC 52813]|uniref:RhoGAP-domain-containing protein n=2 Tax=Rhizopus microsporus TaxID=58291 RepID=A0A2G4T8W8_RHIZD|nr:RhoGAP-domain-containing protein [Rhizopus microsporus ATCC 52813]PHZ17448.1 RhoGAP-domain-containing protein [Rhizopus microsporus ATCC 52813]
MTTEEIVIPNCQGCSKPIEEGAVVAFGESLFHVKCFVCDKCKECVESKTNLLLLDNGKPVCDNCSYNCTACNGIIRDEAIMTGDKAYHSDCFKCVSCKNKIEDLIFTQTKKGIYCTTCYEARKQSRKNKVKPGSLTELPPRQEPTEDPPTPARSRSNSSNTNIQNESLLSVLSPVTLSFFDNNSSDLLDNLTSSLGANLCLNFSPPAEDATQTRINRASEILQSSLRTSSLKYAPGPSTNDITDLDASKLKKELSETRSNLKELEAEYKSLQQASQQALDEFTKVKEEYAKEAAIKHQQEFIIAALLTRNNAGLLSRKDLDKLAMLRLQLENACNELIQYRDLLTTQIDQTVDKQTISGYYSNYQKSLKAQVRSLSQQRDLLLTETKELKTTREEVLKDLINLSTHKQSDSAVPPITISPSESTSSTRPRKLSDAGSVICKVSSRNSFLGDQTPTLFRIKKKGSTMFNIFTNGNNANNSHSNNNNNNNNNSNIKLKPEPSVSTSSTSSTAASSIYGLSTKFSGSSQNLSKKAGLSELNVSYQGNHAFMPASFIRPVKCGVCSDKIWGRSEFRCEGCGFLAHSRCLTQVPSSCLSSYSPLSRSSFDLLSDATSFSATSPISNYENKPLPQITQSGVKPLFGTPLTERVEFEGRPVPLFVTECINAVEHRGLDYEGIYRKSGGAAQIRSIQSAFEQGEKVDLYNEDEINDICAITSVLKQYFRELPNPLLTFETYQAFIELSTMNNDPSKLQKMTHILSQLPQAHQDTLRSLFRHLEKICQSCSKNRMTIKNLAMVFAPTLMRHQDPSRDFLDISYKNAVVEYLLLHTSELF